MTNLNKGQEEAAVGFFDFLLNDEKYMIIDGPGGVGKTYLMGHLVNRVMPEYKKMCKLLGIDQTYEEIHMTATTNKAAQVLSNNIGKPAQTIHSFMNLKVIDDYTTGETKIIYGNNWKIYSNIILFIDECSYIDSTLEKAIDTGTIDCKIIFVGDEYQLGPVKEIASPIYNRGYTTYRLNEPVRNAGQPALINICQQMRETVITGKFKPIIPVKGIIDHFYEHEMEQEIVKHFSQQIDDRRILAYTNKQVQNYNDFIRGLRGLPNQLSIGEHLVNNSAIEISKDKRLAVEEEVIVTDIDELVQEHEFLDGGNFFYTKVVLKTKLGGIIELNVPTDRMHFEALMKYYKSKKLWVNYFYMKNNFPDLRPKDAATVHKAQGSTYNTVYIDMTNLSQCRQPTMVSRLLNVAVSRPTDRIVMYGDLAPKYGGIMSGV